MSDKTYTLYEVYDPAAPFALVKNTPIWRATMDERVYINDRDVRRLLPQQVEYAVLVMDMIQDIEGSPTRIGAYSLCRRHTAKEPTFKDAFRRARARAIYNQKQMVAVFESYIDVATQKAKKKAASTQRQGLLEWAKDRGIRLFEPNENPFEGTQFE